ncbi:MAG: TRAP transporter substrate-binding protein DctP [Clostridiales Family XIII bacterium]|nr:TRAP transporter substrate-binding protein DctP [Clostridiales Family XIII bacterium]
MKCRKGRKARCSIALLMLVLCVAVAGCGGSSGNSSNGGDPSADLSAEETEPITWDVVCSWVQGNFNYTRLELFAEMIEDATNGALIIHIVGGPEIVAEAEQAEACANGVVDAVYTSVGYASGYLPIGEVVTASDMKNSEMAASGGLDFLREEYAKEKLFFYAAVNEVDYTRFHIYTNEEITTYDGLKALKIRASQGVWTSLANSIGMVPSPIVFTELYSALEQGLVKGYLAPAFSGVKEGFFEYTKHMIFPGLGRPGTVMLFNLASWEALPESVQQDVLGAMDDIVTQWDEQVDINAMNTNIEALEAAGGTVVEFSEEDAKRLTDTYGSIAWETLAKNCPNYDIDELKTLFMK